MRRQPSPEEWKMRTAKDWGEYVELSTKDPEEFAAMIMRDTLDAAARLTARTSTSAALQLDALSRWGAPNEESES